MTKTEKGYFNLRINTKYNLRQKVYIAPIKVWGKILNIFIGMSGDIQYNCRYFDGVSPKDCYFYEDELSLEEEKKVRFEK